MDAAHLWNLATAVGATAAWQTRTATVALAGDELAAQFAPGMGIDSGIDGFVRQGKTRLRVADICCGDHLQPSMVFTTPQHTL